MSGAKAPLSISILGIGKILNIVCRSSASICHVYRRRGKKQSKSIPAGDENSTTSSINFLHCF